MFVALLLTALCGLFLLRFIFWRLLPWIYGYKSCIDALRDLDCPKPHWLFGHLKEFGFDEKGQLRRAALSKTYPKCTKIWYGPVSVFFSCHHPDIAKTLLTADIPKDEMVYRYLRPWLGDGLVTSTGQKWKRNRYLLSPAFHFDILKGYVVHHNEAAIDMFEIWERRQTGGSVNFDAFEDLSRLALDNLLRCIFSETLADRPESNTYLETVNYLKDITYSRLRLPWRMFDFIFYSTETGKRYREALKVALSFTEAAVQKKRSLLREMNLNESDTTKPDFLTMLFRAKDSDGVGLTDEEIRHELDTFIAAGHDTVASAMSWAFYNLAIYPELQEECRAEAMNVLEGKQVFQWNDLENLSYLTMFIKESMRLYPPVSAIGRKIRQPLTIPLGFGSDQYNVDSSPTSGTSRTLPKGSNVQVDIFTMHRNPHIWEEPNKFEPERFLPEIAAKRSPYAFVPFSSGQRNCIGQHFAMIETKVTLALALTRYRFTVDDSFPAPIMSSHLTLGSETGIHLRAEKLQL